MYWWTDELLVSVPFLIVRLRLRRYASTTWAVFSTHNSLSPNVSYSIFIEVWIKLHLFSVKKIQMKMSCVNCCYWEKVSGCRSKFSWLQSLRDMLSFVLPFAWLCLEQATHFCITYPYLKLDAGMISSANKSGPLWMAFRIEIAQKSIRSTSAILDQTH